MSKEKDSKFSVFISHSREDADIAKNIARTLEKENLLVSSESKLSFGENWSSRVKDNIKAADAYVILISPSALESNHCRNEWADIQEKAWHSKSVKVYPMIAEGCTSPSFVKSMMIWREEDETGEKKKSDYIATLLSKHVPGLKDWSLVEKWINNTSKLQEAKEQSLEERAERFEELISLIKEEEKDSEVEHAKDTRSKSC